MKVFRYSEIDTAHSCLEKYNLQYVQNLPQPGAASLDLHFGSAMHAAIQACLEGDDPLATFDIYWNSVKEGEYKPSAYDWASLANLAVAFLPRFSRLHAKKYKILQMETEILGEVGGYPFRGTPDFLGDYEDVPSVVDFKTSGYMYRKEKIQVNEQMPIYAHLAQQQLGFKAEQLVYVIFVKNECRIQVVKTPLTKRLLDAAVRNVILSCSDLSNRKEFTRNPNNCTMGRDYKCPYFEKCHGESA